MTQIDSILHPDRPEAPAHRHTWKPAIRIASISTTSRSGASATHLEAAFKAGVEVGMNVSRPSEQEIASGD
jgi:hypothetical protein